MLLCHNTCRCMLMLLKKYQLPTKKKSKNKKTCLGTCMPIYKNMAEIHAYTCTCQNRIDQNSKDVHRV